MIGTILKTSWVELSRDRVAQVLAFVLPVIFFSIFAIIFGGLNGDSRSHIRVAVVDEDHSEASMRLLSWLKKEESLNVTSGRESSRQDGKGKAAGTRGALDRRTAIKMVRTGQVPVAIILLKGLERSLGAFQAGQERSTAIEMHIDPADPVASNAVAGLLQAGVMEALPDLFLNRGLEYFRRFGGQMTEQQEWAVGSWLPLLRQRAEQSQNGSSATTSGGTAKGSTPLGPLKVETIDEMAARNPAQHKSSVIAFYAAGTGVMFLLFTVVGAAGVFLDYEEAGVLERLLSSRLTMSQLLVGRWVFITLLGSVQVSIMFVWGWLVFHLNLWTPSHLAGFVVMTGATAAAAAALGLFLAAACRTRGQLHGLSTILILTMSAVGGSMFPRYLMPDFMQKAGLLTFNAWALDGYRKVFWFERPLRELWPQVAVLVCSTVFFLWLARRLARRWESE